MNQQDKLLVCKIIVLVHIFYCYYTAYMLLIYLQAQEKHKYLRKFAEGWPIRDFMSRYLRNRVAQCKIGARAESLSGQSVSLVSYLPFTCVN